MLALKESVRGDWKMTVEVLVATMNQTDYSLLEKMNISTDAIVGNQCDRNSVEKTSFNGYNIKYYSFEERGVGLNRNNTLMRSKADICVFADDDMVFYDDYEKIITRAFTKLPDADVLCLNIDDEPKIRPVNTKTFRVRWYNYGRYGAARIAIRRKSVIQNGIFFNLSFGGGTEYSQGEDTLFLFECLQKGLHVYAVPVTIAKLIECRESTWFQGYTEKFFFDKGVYYGCLHFCFSWLLGLRYCLKYRKRYKDNFSWWHAYSQFLKGMRSVTHRWGE